MKRVLVTFQDKQLDHNLNNSEYVYIFDGNAPKMKKNMTIEGESSSSTSTSSISSIKIQGHPAPLKQGLTPIYFTSADAPKAPPELGAD